MFDKTIFRLYGEKLCGDYKHCGIHHETFHLITENRMYDSFNELCEPMLCEITSVLNGNTENLLNKDSVTGNAFVLEQAYRGEILKDISVAVILNNDVLRKIESLIGELYLLPSSRYEWVVIPYDHEISVDDLIDMVHHVNDVVVGDNDILSYQVLRFSNGKLTPV